MASGAGSKVNKDAASLLRFGLPGIPKQVRKDQVNIESIREDVSRKRYSAAEGEVKSAKAALKNYPTLTYSNANIDELQARIVEAAGFNRGSEQEGKARASALTLQDNIIREFNDYEESLVPKDYKVEVPKIYDGLSRLNGRATVEMTFKKPNGEVFDIEGVNFKDAKMKMVVDGYSAPLTSGNFVELVNDGFYSNMKIQRSDGFVVQTGRPEGEAEGVIGTGAEKALGRGKFGERLLPLEIMVKGDKAPFYEQTIEDNERGGQATVLPFSSYGALGWAREEYDPNSGSSQFFWLLFDSDLTPGGKNVLDGRYPCFGYVTEGADFLRDITEGTVITSAKVTKGLENVAKQ
ncbi:hypothetical protein ScalyP_jg2504 [Parmales sp. scaly parma]|nr:hypothetical protein ScalyP_jg2504 [Parmales sp. scaly parma]